MCIDKLGNMYLLTWIVFLKLARLTTADAAVETEEERRLAHHSSHSHRVTSVTTDLSVVSLSTLRFTENG